MLSFAKLLENISLNEAIMPDSRALAVVKAGLNIRPDFWDDFLKICNQPALNELLGVRKEVIAKWPSLIRDSIQEIERQNSQEAATKKAEVIRTGY